MILNRLKEALRSSLNPALTLAGFVKSAESLRAKEPLLFKGLHKAATSLVGESYLVDCFLETAWPRDLVPLQKEAGAKVKRSEIYEHITQDLGSFLEKHAHEINKKLFTEGIPGLEKEAGFADNFFSPATTGGVAGALSAKGNRIAGFKAGMEAGKKVSLKNIASLRDVSNLKVAPTSGKSKPRKDLSVDTGGHRLLGSPLEGAYEGYQAGKALRKKKPEVTKQASMDAIMHRSKQKILGKPTVAQKLSTGVAATPKPVLNKLAEIIQKKIDEKKKSR